MYGRGRGRGRGGAVRGGRGGKVGRAPAAPLSPHDQAIHQLQRAFGSLDIDVLSAVLEVCGGDSRKATEYLSATGNEPAYDAWQLKTQESGIPPDYPLNGAGRVFADYNRNAKPKQVDAGEVQIQDFKALFTTDKRLLEHLEAQKKNLNLYVATLFMLLEQGLEITKGSRARILAACWARNDYILPNYLLMKKDELFSLPQVLTAVNMLDAPRKLRSLERKIKTLQNGKAHIRKIRKLKSLAQDQKVESHIGSVSGSLTKHIRRWVKSIDVKKLEFFALQLPKEPWVELSDILHLHPSDFQLDWFLPFVHGKAAPPTAVVEVCHGLAPDNIVSVLKKGIQIPYSYLRTKVKPLPAEAKLLVSQYAPLNTLIWFYEELECKEVEKLLDTRLDTEKPTFGYGKLMERMLYFKNSGAPFYYKLVPIAEERLKQIRVRLESPVVVLGDASYSMDVAIRTSTVIASVLTAIASAELKFFTDRTVDPPLEPCTAQQVLDVASSVKADGMTCPAAALWDFYRSKKAVKFFVVVTDEVENIKFNDVYFPTLFDKYCKEVYPAKIVFVSFLEQTGVKGRMVRAIENMGYKPLQFALDGKRPDLTKLDSILAALASESKYFVDQVKRVTNDLAQFQKEEAKKEDQKGKTEKISFDPEHSEKKMKSEATPAVQKKRKIVITPITNPLEGFIGVALDSIAKGTLKDKDEIECESLKRSLDSNGLCVVCDEREACMAIVPCGHMISCEKCTAFKECPFCRQPVERTMKIFKS